MSRFTIRSRRSKIVINGNIILETKLYPIIPGILVFNTVRKSTPAGMNTYFNVKIFNKFISLYKI